MWRRVGDGDGVEQTVVARRVRRDLKCAAEPPAIRDDEQKVFCRFGVFDSGEFHAAIAKELSQSGVGVEERAFEPSHLRRALQHGDVEPEADRIEKMPVLDAPNVDAAIGAIDRKPRRRFTITSRHADGLREVVPGSGGNEREPAIGTGMHDRIGNLAPGSVAADGDDRRCTVVERAARERGFVSRARRPIKCRVADADVREGASDAGFGACAAPAPRGRIQDDANALGNVSSREWYTISR